MPAGRRGWRRVSVQGLCALVITCGFGAQEPRARHSIAVRSAVSLVADITKGNASDTAIAREAAANLLETLDTGRLESARRARRLYGSTGRLGRGNDDQNALAWWCDYLAAPTAEKKRLLADFQVAGLVRFFSEDNYHPLRSYLRWKYDLGDSPLSQNKPLAALIQSLLTEGSPIPSSLRKAATAVQQCGVKRGQTVVDVGCGPGLHAFLLAREVGPAGRVLAADTNPLALDYVRALA